MKKIATILLAYALLASGPAADAKGASAFTVPQAFLRKAKRDRHTIFLATFDKADSNDADFAVGRPLAGGFGCDPKVDGKFGKGVAIYGMSNHLNYRGYGNLNRDKGTVQFWVKSKPGTNIWNDGKDHYFFATHYLDRAMGLMKKGKGNRLQIWTQHHRAGTDDKHPAVIPVADLDPGKWHHVIASWNMRKPRLWLAVDGKGIEVSGRGDSARVPMHIFFIGGGWHHKHGHIPADAIFDEFKISRLTLPELIQQHKVKLPVSDADIMKVQDSVRKYLTFAQKLSFYGGWAASAYTWPTLMPMHTNARAYVLPDRTCRLSHGFGGGAAALGIIYLYAYEVTGDQRWLEQARSTGHFVLAAQQPEGHWVYMYRLTDFGAKPYRSYISLEDGHQSQMMMLLSYLYSVTKEKRFLEGALKSADFILKAQNPDGSFSGGYSLKTGGKGGGYFNDECTQDCMNMLLMARYMTKDPKYLAGWRRTADWVVSAQLGAPTYGWADQYDKNNKPRRARHFEPAAATMRGGLYASRILLMVYDVTGEKKYLEPIRKYLDWLKNKAATKPKDGKPGYFPAYHHENGRPIAMLRGKVYYLDTPDAVAQMKKDPYLRSYSHSVHTLAQGRMDRIIKRLNAIEKSGARFKSTPAPKPRLGPGSLGGALDLVARQHPAGPWVSKGGRKVGGVGAGFRLSETRIIWLLNTLEAVKIASGLPHRTNYESRSAFQLHRIFTRRTMAFVPWLNVKMSPRK